MKRAHLASGSSPPPPARSCSALRQPPPSGDRNLASPRPQGSREMSWFPSRQQHHDTRLFLGRCPQGMSWINAEFRKLLPVAFDFKNPNERQTSCGGWRPLAGHLEMISGGHGSQSCSGGRTKAPWARGQTQPRLSAIDLQAGPFPPPGPRSGRWCLCHPSTECVTPAHCHADGAGHACHLSPGSAAGLGPRAPSLNPGCRAEARNSPRCPRKPESLSRAFNAHSVSTHACLTQVPAPLTGPGPRPSPDASPRQTPQLPLEDTGPRELPRPRHGCRLP